MISPLQRLHTSSEELNRVQDGLVLALNQLIGLPLSNVVLTNRAALTASYVNVPHRLGRRPQGWVAVSPHGSGNIDEDPNQPDAEKASFIRVRAAVAGSSRFLVF